MDDPPKPERPNHPYIFLKQRGNLPDANPIPLCLMIQNSFKSLPQQAAKTLHRVRCPWLAARLAPQYPIMTGGLEVLSIHVSWHDAPKLDPERPGTMCVCMVDSVTYHIASSYHCVRQSAGFETQEAGSFWRSGLICPLYSRRPFGWWC